VPTNDDENYISAVDQKQKGDSTNIYILWSMRVSSVCATYYDGVWVPYVHTGDGCTRTQLARLHL
jgi:hypothetical protein